LRRSRTHKRRQQQGGGDRSSAHKQYLGE
jgi:hypothetical protein